MKNILLPTISVLLFFTTPLIAEETISQKLPFIGERTFNFDGGSGTERYIKIKKDGYTIVGSCGAPGLALEGEDNCYVDYKGKYSNPLIIKKDEKLLIHENKIYSLNKDDSVEVGCKGDTVPCESELYESTLAPTSSMAKKSSNTKMVSVPQIDGNCVNPEEVIKAAGLKPKIISVHGPIDNDASGGGCAYRQSPKAGTMVKKGSKVTFRSWWEAG